MRAHLGVVASLKRTLRARTERVTITKRSHYMRGTFHGEKLFQREKKRDRVTRIAEIVNRPRLERGGDIFHRCFREQIAKEGNEMT